MNFEILATEEFARQAKQLAKKYRSLATDLSAFQEALQKNPTMGVNLAPNLFKCRMAISSKGKGKSAGARIITYLLTDDRKIYLVSIYDKSEREAIAMQEIRIILKAEGLWIEE